jgi:hypothetical protein
MCYIVTSLYQEERKTEKDGCKDVEQVLRIRTGIWRTTKERVEEGCRGVQSP